MWRANRALEAARACHDFLRTEDWRATIAALAAAFVQPQDGIRTCAILMAVRQYRNQLPGLELAS